jgi:7-cyano-7-deazaguanine synthase
MIQAAPKAVVLLSGGLDSATVLAIGQDQGFECFALAVDYGQRHRSELEAAQRVAEAAGAPLKILPLDLRAIGGSALTADIDVPEVGTTGIPVTYVPARNTILLSLALAYAEVLGADDIFIGVNAVERR